METVEDTDRLVITLDQDEIQKKFVELNGIWLNVSDISDQVSASMTEKFNEIKNTTQASEALGIKADIDENVRVFSIMPSLK